MKLYKLWILISKTGPHHHGVSISSTGMCRSTGKVSSSISSRGQNGVLRMNTVDGSIFHVQGHDTHTFSLLRHHQIHCKVFNEVCGIKRQRPPIKGVQHSMTRTIRSTGTPIRLSPFSKIQTLTPKCPLVNLTLIRPGKGKSKLLQFQHSLGGLTTHVMNGILVTQPIASLDSIIHMPAPIIFVHVSKGGIDSSLGCHGVGTGGEEFGDAGGFESCFRETHGGTEACSSGSNDDGIVFMVDNCVISLEAGREGTGCRCCYRGGR
mmetsp:Transcript_12168/g.17734  ORF Transcript_12168/g.17734 Transcript_12168/m.17734 type:complete len:264 (+) Transcript_12168:750-1541(+)